MTGQANPRARRDTDRTRGPESGTEALSWMFYDPVYGWQNPQRLRPVTDTTCSTALAYFPTQNCLYCAHVGDSDSALRYTRYTGQWDSDVGSQRATDNNPALAAYRERLHCVRVLGDALVHASTGDGVAWSDDVTLPATDVVWEGAALAAHGQHLYAAYKGYDPAVYWCRYDGIAWTEARYAELFCLTRPALVVYHDQLHCLYEDTAGLLQHSVFDDTHLTWGTPQPVPGIGGRSLVPPAAAVLDDTLHCVTAYGDDTGRLWWQQLTADGWQTTAHSIPLPKAPWKRYPSLAAYAQRLYCVYGTRT